jgi:hypothetical protein
MIAFGAAEVAIRRAVIATKQAFAFQLHLATKSPAFAYLLPDKRQSVRRSGEFKCQPSRSQDRIATPGDGSLPKLRRPSERLGTEWTLRETQFGET